MSNKIPKFVATAEYEEEVIQYFGEGDTPEDALKDFTAQPLLDYAQYWEIPDGAEIDVQVYTAGTPKEAGWCEEDANPDWTWCLVNRVSAHKVILEEA